jgi:glycosyltransferase involved in cell wall biosynthesis
MNGTEKAADSTGLPLVTVIINCYNGALYLREAIESVYAQTHPNWEVVFWDNASTDNSGEIAQSYDSRIRYFRGEENIPLGAARNRAMAQVRGDFVGFLDCDDIWLPDKIERQVKAMSDGISALCYGGIIEIDSRGREIGRAVPCGKSGYLFERLLSHFDIHLPTAFIRKSSLDESGLVFDGKVTASEEYCLFMQLAVGRPFAVINDVLAKYRIHDGALTNKSISKWADEREYTLEQIKKNHPEIELKFARGFKDAYARGRYYRARYFMSSNDRMKAIKEMFAIFNQDFRYFVLFLTTFCPVSVWNRIHKIKSGRSI